MARRSQLSSPVIRLFLNGFAVYPRGAPEFGGSFGNIFCFCFFGLRGSNPPPSLPLGGRCPDPKGAPDFGGYAI